MAGDPTVGARTGASFVRTGETGVIVDRFPPGQQCAETDEDERTLAVFLEAIEEAQTMDCHGVRDRVCNSTATGLWTTSSPLWIPSDWQEASRQRQAYNHGHGKCLLKVSL